MLPRGSQPKVPPRNPEALFCDVLTSLYLHIFLKLLHTFILLLYLMQFSYLWMTQSSLCHLGLPGGASKSDKVYGDSGPELLIRFTSAVFGVRVFFANRPSGLTLPRMTVSRPVGRSSPFPERPLPTFPYLPSPRESEGSGRGLGGSFQDEDFCLTLCPHCSLPSPPRLAKPLILQRPVQLSPPL